jgi:hypothetical protein
MTPRAQFPRVSTALQRAMPKLLVVVDTEEEFDWSKPHSRSETRVDHIKHQDRLQAVFNRYGIAPTYVVDYPVASQEAGYRLLRDWLIDGKCKIGAHLHPWVNPPFDEAVNARNSYPGNLPALLEKEKLKRLTETIECNFGHRPTVYRAGRYGIGPATGATLEELGYEIDTSIVPFTDFRRDGGPDFSDFDTEPFWFGPSKHILELPLTVAWHGTLNGLARRLQPTLMSELGLQLHLPGMFARLGLLERIRLTPEGASFAELKRLTDTMIAAGKCLFVFSYHSPSVVPGNTPYVRDEAELQGFMRVIEQYCEYFLGTCGGEGATPHEVRALYKAELSCTALPNEGFHANPNDSWVAKGNA